MTTDVLYHPDMGVVTDFVYRDSIVIMDELGPCYINTWVDNGDVWTNYNTERLK